MFFTSCPCICVRPCISLLDNRHKTKKEKKTHVEKKSQAIKLEKDRQRNGDALEFFFLYVLGLGPALFEEMHFQDEMSF